MNYDNLSIRQVSGDPSQPLYMVFDGETELALLRPTSFKDCEYTKKQIEIAKSINEPIIEALGDLWRVAGRGHSQNGRTLCKLLSVTRYQDCLVRIMPIQITVTVDDVLLKAPINKYDDNYRFNHRFA